VQEQLGMKNSVLFAAPIPEKYHSIGETIQQAVEIAVQEAEENGMNKRGKEVTPWILRRVGELSGGKSLPSSILSCPCSTMVSTHRVSSDVALIENTSLIGMSSVHISTGRV
jgi:pseudouridine-5'-phosphate glycosidase/pseudouridine kinase